MKRPQSDQRIASESPIAFERQRLLNLIDSKLRRREIQGAREFAEELFKKEILFALRQATGRLKRCISTILKIIAALIGLFFICTISAVLDIIPSFSVLAGSATVAGIISVFVVGRFIVKRLEEAIRTIMVVFDTRRYSFIETILTSGAFSFDLNEWLWPCSPPLVRQSQIFFL